MWTFLSQHQQRGAQLHARGQAPKQAGEAPKEAVAGREAQDHDYADLDAGSGEPQRDIDYPATNPPEREGDITPTAPGAADKRVDWDAVVQLERADERSGEAAPDDDLPLPEGK